MELVVGIEPTTCGLRYRCSAIEPHQHICEGGISDPRFRFIITYLYYLINNRSPAHYECAALPSEPSWRLRHMTILILYKAHVNH